MSSAKFDFRKCSKCMGLNQNFDWNFKMEFVNFSLKTDTNSNFVSIITRKESNLFIKINCYLLISLI